jgi:hypothetical protein
MEYKQLDSQSSFLFREEGGLPETFFNPFRRVFAGLGVVEQGLDILLLDLDTSFSQDRNRLLESRS